MNFYESQSIRTDSKFQSCWKAVWKGFMLWTQFLNHLKSFFGILSYDCVFFVDHVVELLANYGESIVI